MQDEYRTVARAGTHEIEINRSRFLCSLAPAATEQEAQDFIAAVRTEHATATHNCWAYVIGADAGIQKASDDGEPGGTALRTVALRPLVGSGPGRWCWNFR